MRATIIIPKKDHQLWQKVANIEEKAEYRYSVVGSLRALGHKSDDVKKLFKLRLEEFRSKST